MAEQPGLIAEVCCSRGAKTLALTTSRVLSTLKIKETRCSREDKIA